MSWKHLVVAFSAAAALAVGLGAQAGSQDLVFAVTGLERLSP